MDSMKLDMLLRVAIILVAVISMILCIIKIIKGKRNGKGIFYYIKNILGTCITVLFCIMFFYFSRKQMDVFGEYILQNYPSSIDFITYGDAINTVCDNIKWTTTTAEASENGLAFVQMDADYDNNNTHHKIKIQFNYGLTDFVSVDESTPFSISFVGIDDAKETEISDMQDIIYDMFEAYASSHKMEVNTSMKGGILEAGEKSKAKSSTAENNLADNYIQAVKNGYPVSIPDITYADAFNEFFENPQWGYLQSDDGQNIVEFTGKCSYKNAKVEAKLQFIVLDDENFEQGNLTFNNIPQSDDECTEMIYNVFREYANSHNIDDIDSNNTDGDGEYEDYSDNGYDNEEDNEEEDITGYICPNSDSEKLSTEEVLALSKKERRLARNEIYARYGRKFSDQSLQDYFDSQDWYVPLYEPEEFNDDLLNEIEKYNANFLKEFE